MFAKTIIDSDAFIEMPISARLLYYDLAMRADDDGFINAPKKIMRFVGATNDDMNILIMRKFIIPFDNGVVVIKHWRIHNYIRKDTYNETSYKEQKSMLELDENKAYRLSSQLSVDEPSTQVRLGKDSIDNNIISCANDKTNNEELEKFFESIWKLYPIKKGKGQISKTKKQNLQKIGYEHIKRCIDRFVEDMNNMKRDKQYWMHGSTFFNSGYVDYLDDNCEQEEVDEEYYGAKLF